MEPLLKSEIYALLEQKQISCEKMEHDAVYTMEDMDKAGITARGTVCKNLFLRDAKGKNHFLVTVPENKLVELIIMPEQIGCSRLSFASAERLEKYLHLPQGSVSPLGLLNDESCSVVFVADEDLKTDSAVGIHPNDNTATIWLAFPDLQRLIQEHGNTILFARFPSLQP